MTTHVLFSLHFFLQNHTFPNRYTAGALRSNNIPRVAIRWRHCRQVQRPIRWYDNIPRVVMPWREDTAGRLNAPQLQAMTCSSPRCCCIQPFHLHSFNVGRFFHFPFWIIHTLGMQHIFDLEGFKKLLKGTYIPYKKIPNIFEKYFKHQSNKLYLEVLNRTTAGSTGRSQIWGNTLHQLHNVHQMYIHQMFMWRRTLHQMYNVHVKEDNAHCVHC